ncbi:unnamed protein product [Allacma fusca]|uniref:Uncharacterized protein n=1 Tax=Allacma fusca TaxID=39272 RepID=A0A8J2KKL8_9HEXA|nr:unnamed protein product [Allacma fusca]
MLDRPRARLFHSYSGDTEDYSFTRRPNNRIEWIVAFMHSNISNCFPITVNKEKVYFSETMEMEDGDVIGYVIPPKFGGTSIATFNRFPACQSCTKELEDVFTSLTVDVTSHKYLALKFEYEGGNQTRPLYFYYTVLKFYDLEQQKTSLYHTYYGLITNNADKNSNRVQPYAQFQEKRKRRNSTLHKIL